MNALQLTTVLAAALASTARASCDGGGQRWNGDWNDGSLDPAMETACIDGDLASVTALLAQHQADLPAYVLNARSRFGETVLELAAFNGHAGIANALLAAGADPNAQDGYGRTPLHCAARYNHPDVARALVEGGADPMIPDNNGRTALPFAQQYRHARREDNPIVQYLQNEAPADRAVFQLLQETRAFGARAREALAPTVASKCLDGPDLGAASLPSIVGVALRSCLPRETAINGLTFLLETARARLGLWAGGEHAPDAAPAIRQKMVTYYTTAVAKLQAKIDQLNADNEVAATKEGAGAGLARDADTNAKAGGGK